MYGMRAPITASKLKRLGFFNNHQLRPTLAIITVALPLNFVVTSRIYYSQKTRPKSHPRPNMSSGTLETNGVRIAVEGCVCKPPYPISDL